MVDFKDAEFVVSIDTSGASGKVTSKDPPRGWIVVTFSPVVEPVT